MNDKKFLTVEKVEPMFLGGHRDWSVDVLRCLSCFMVCCIHAADMTRGHGFTTLIGPSELTHHLIYRMILSSPTDLFVMVSGIFFLSPERHVTPAKIWRKNVVKMTAAYIFWSLIYALYRIHVMDPAPDITAAFFVQQWLKQPTHLWYIPMIVGLYILSPIMRPITATGDTKLFRYIIMLFMGGMILWTIYNWPSLPYGETYINPAISKTPMGVICQYTFWMLYGWIAYTYRPTKGFRYLIYCSGIAAIILGIILNFYNEARTGDVFMIAVTQKFGILPFIKNTALFYFIVTVFRDHKFSDRTKKFLKRLSDDTLIIYLVHWLILLTMSDNAFLYTKGMSPWIGVWIYAIIAYIGGFIIAEIFHAFWNPVKSQNKRTKGA